MGGKQLRESHSQLRAAILHSLGSCQNSLKVKGQLTTFDEARKLVLSRCLTLGSETVCLPQLLGRVLAEPLVTTVDMPRFDNSAVDGYGLTAADASQHGSVSLRLVGESAAGYGAKFMVREGETARVLTGAPIPAGVETVVMQEDVGVDAESVSITTPVVAGANIRRRAEEYTCGDRLLEAGAICSPPVISLIASAGHSSSTVFRRPRVGILTTGNELVEPGEILRDGQIYASNAFGLAAAIESLGIRPVLSLHLRDDLDETCDAVMQALEQCEVIITSGGVSVGSRDYLRTAFERCGVDPHIWGVAVKPGQPFFFGSNGGCLIFGLPGNPVSVMVTYFVLVRPALLRIMGTKQMESEQFLELVDPIEARIGKTEFVRGVMKGGNVEPLSARGSHMSGGLAKANCLIHVPPDKTRLEAGSTVKCTPLNWSHI